MDSNEKEYMKSIMNRSKENFYNDLISITTNIDDSNYNQIITSMLSTIDISKLNLVTIDNVDIAFCKILTQATSCTDLKELSNMIEFYTVSKILHSSNSLYSNNIIQRLRQINNVTVTFESDESTLNEMKFILKYLNIEFKEFVSLLNKSNTLPHYKQILADIYTIHRDLRYEDSKLRFRTVIKSEKTLEIIHAILSRAYEIDITDIANFGTPTIDIEGCQMVVFNFILDLNHDYSDSIQDIIINAEDLDRYVQEERDLKKEYKNTKKSLYAENEQVETSSEKSEDLLELQVEENPVLIPFDLDYQSKKRILNTEKFLLLKSDTINIDSKILSNIKVVNIDSVSEEVLKGLYSAVIVNTKNISHASMYRVKSLIGNTKLIYTTKTNKRVLIEDIFSKF